MTTRMIPVFTINGTLIAFFESKSEAIAFVNQAPRDRYMEDAVVVNYSMFR